MKITRENLPKSRVKLTIEVPEEKTKKFFEEAYKKLAPTVEIKGFRPGQAPRVMTLEAIGYGKYNQTALDIALPETYFEAIQSEKIIPVQPPSVSVKEFIEGKPLVYDAEVDVVPEIKLCDYKKIKIKYVKPKIEVKKEEVDKLIEKLRYQSAIFNDVNRPARKGDRIEIDFEGLVDNVKQESLCSRNHPLILGEGILIPGFEKELEGMKKDEVKEFDLEVPKIKDKLQKKKAHFKVKMISVKEVILPEIDNEFAKKFGHDTAETLINTVEEKLREEKELTERQKLEKEVLDKIISGCKLEIPESLIVQEVSRRITEIQNQMGPGFGKYLESIGKKIEDLQKDIRPVAENAVRTGLILGEIARAEKIMKPEIKDQKEQEKMIRKTVDFLVKLVTE